MLDKRAVDDCFSSLLSDSNQRPRDYKSGEDYAHISLITRPLTFGTPDFKKIERMFLRAMMINPTDSIILNYFSINEIKFYVLKGYDVNPEYVNPYKRKDFDMGLFARSKYRQFLFAFAGTLHEKSEIQFLETEITKEYENEKMR